ncbi:MAG: tetratricopeptide repeat-containing sensor histidine kinase [Salinivirgaceae bacterium]|nr:tetratricopeptide repeat-containing sensor histidine kinase [Salinivirgaceae bacterium]
MRKTKYILSLILVFLLSASFANKQAKIDSLNALLTISQNDSNYVDILNELSKTCRWNDPIMAIDYAVKAEKIAESNNYLKGLALSYHNMGAIYADKRNNELAIEYYGRSLRIQQTLNNSKGMADLYGNMGLIFRRERNFEKALEYHNKSLEIKRKLKDTTGISYSYGNIGLVYSDQGKYDKALIHFYNSLRLKETLKDKYGMANSYGNIGVVYLKIGSIDQAQVNLERGLMYFEETKNNTGIAESLIYLGDIYWQQKNPAKAIKALKRSMDIYKENGNMKGMADANLKIGEIQFAIGREYNASQRFLVALDYYEKLNETSGIISSKYLLANYNYNIDSLDLAKYQLKKALDLAEKNHFDKERYNILKLLAEVYIKQENYYRASIVLTETNKLGDSISRLKLDKEVLQIQMQHDFDRQLQLKDFEEKRRIQEQQLRVKRITQVGNTFLLGLILASIMAVIIYRKSRIIKKKNAVLEEQQNKISEQLETLKKQKADLQSANETKDRFLAIIGHDLRNPFNAINSFISMVTEPSYSFDSQMIKKYLMLIKEAGANAQSLLENLFEWALNQSGELEIKKEKVSLNFLLKGNILLVKEMAAQKNITIIEQLFDDPAVVVDKNMINTVIRNLVSNAVKFTPDNGKIIVSTIVNDGDIKITVRDTGCGISNEQLASLVESGVIKKGKDGMASSGLGLILCKDFLANHHQDLHVESTPNIGTSFWFYLPLSD